jgi:hypothetical protein
MAKAQREFLAKFVEGNEKETARMLKEFRAEQQQRAETLEKELKSFVRQMKKATHELTDGFHDERMKAHQAWQQMERAMGKKREEGAQKLAAAPRPRRPAREDKVLAFLKENSSGMTLAELAYSMDMPSAATAKTLRQMLSKKEIRKKDQLYMLAS